MLPQRSRRLLTGNRLMLRPNVCKFLAEYLIRIGRFNEAFAKSGRALVLYSVSPIRRTNLSQAAVL